ncbi:MAG TPA: DUF255 domain-containing protein [Candidatus Binatia bacterium]|nr:DUF255 domain-containing protein [Candidatus Binatia bacterium]
MLRFSPNRNLARLVRWFESEDDAFATARVQDRPVAMFLAAFWCRYCQRMDEEAFSDRENMALLNAYFVALRVENAKRPDIDTRYNLNGWPTIAFLTPNGKLLAASNYLPTAEFQELLLNVYMEYEKHKEEFRSGVRSATLNPVTPKCFIRREPDVSFLKDITESIIGTADHDNGGYGNGQKFIHAEVNEFLLSHYDRTHDARLLDHVRLTLEQMRSSAIYDAEEGGYFRTTTGADWVQPHREKLLSEQAGLLLNCLHLFRITESREHARIAEEIIDYLDHKLFDSAKPAFFGCQDFLRVETKSDEFFTIIDDCIYTDANALAVIAYLDAAAILNRPEHEARALKVLDFLWHHNRDEQRGMFHYFDEAPQIPGLLIDQARMGIALVRAFVATGENSLLDRATKLADVIVAQLACPAGGYFDRGQSDLDFFGPRLILIDQNGITASFFLMFANATGDAKYRDAAVRAFSAFRGDFASYGIQAAPFGQAIGEWLRQEESE